MKGLHNRLRAVPSVWQPMSSLKLVQKQTLTSGPRPRTAAMGRHYKEGPTEFSWQMITPRTLMAMLGITALSWGAYFDSPIYFLKTLYLFTASDHLTFILPQAMYGYIGALSGPMLTRNASLSVTQVTSNIPAVLWWTWLHTLVFTMHNQSCPGAITEDKNNKPWRPIAAGRITVEQTRLLLWMLIPLTLLNAIYFGGIPETIFVLVGNFMYNEGRGSDKNILVRNWSIATAFALYGTGATEVASGGTSTLNSTGVIWTLMVTAIIMTTMQIQDMKDQAGDATRGRCTIPLVYGDGTARWSIVVPVVFWTIATGWYWRVFLLYMVPTIVLGATICLRLLAFRNTRADELTWKLWSFWVLSLYCLPLLHAWSL